MNKKRIIFDEYALGLRNDYRIVSLLKEFHLQFFIINILLILLLLVWRTFSTIENDAYETKEEKRSNTIYIKSNRSAGLSNLIQINLRPKEIVKNALDRIKELSHILSLSDEQINKAMLVVKEDRKSAIEMYIEIRKILNKFKETKK
jgi:hypothetical protein